MTIDTLATSLGRNALGCSPRATALVAGIGCTLAEQDCCDWRFASGGLDRPEPARNCGQAYGHPSSVTLQAV